VCLVKSIAQERCIRLYRDLDGGVRLTMRAADGFALFASLAQLAAADAAVRRLAGDEREWYP